MKFSSWPWVWLKSATVFCVLCFLAVPSQAVVTRFWFSGHITEIYNPSNAMPFLVERGMPFTGTVTWNSSQLNWSVSNSFPAGVSATYYFDNSPGYQMQLNLGGHVLTNSTAGEQITGLISIHDGYNSEDSLVFETGSTGLHLDGAPFVGDKQFSVISLYLDDNSKTAHSSADIPAFVPDLNKYRDSRELIWGVYIDDGKPTQIFSVAGEIDFLAAEELYALHYQRLDAHRLQLDWSLAAVGYQLESCPDLNLDAWVPVVEKAAIKNGRHEVVVDLNEDRKFFRLKK